MFNYHFDFHILTLIFIMLVSGAFGGFLNYLHNFDTLENEQKIKLVKYKYIFLGIGSAFLVPVFLKMIASDLIKESTQFDNNSYLIFAGFCLIAAIFSRRFITSIGERILEKAEKAEKVSKENKQLLESAKLELTSTQERIEDVKSAINLNNPESKTTVNEDTESNNLLIELVDSYITKTSVSDYSERLKLKAELGRKMGQIIVRNNLDKNKLLKDHPKEGMYLALAYSVELKPDKNSLLLLNLLSTFASQLYTKYVILLGYRTLASSNLIDKNQVKEVFDLVQSFRKNADKPLLRNIDDTISVLRFIDSSI